MEESKGSKSQKATFPVYLIVGDSGVGKSTFINCILGSNKAFAPLTNQGGASVT